MLISESYKGQCLQTTRVESLSPTLAKKTKGHLTNDEKVTRLLAFLAKRGQKTGDSHHLLVRADS